MAGIQVGSHSEWTASSGSWEGPDLDTASPHNLAYYLPAALCEGINSGSLQPEHRSATVGFIQFLEFDQLIEMEGPDAAAESLDELVTEVQRAVDDRGITFLGSDISADGGKLILTESLLTRRLLHIR
jgi:hypothetical protein